MLASPPQALAAWSGPPEADGAGGRYPSELCGLMVLYCCLHVSVTTLASKIVSMMRFRRVLLWVNSLPWLSNASRVYWAHNDGGRLRFA